MTCCPSSPLPNQSDTGTVSTGAPMLRRSCRERAEVGKSVREKRPKSALSSRKQVRVGYRSLSLSLSLSPSPSLSLILTSKLQVHALFSPLCDYYCTPTFVQLAINPILWVLICWEIGGNDSLFTCGALAHLLFQISSPLLGFSLCAPYLLEITGVNLRAPMGL